MRKRLVGIAFLLILAAVFWQPAMKFLQARGQIWDLPPKIAEQPRVMLLLRLNGDEQLIQIDLEEAVVGYLAGEMPALAPEEALKAQAVAVRSFAYCEMAAAGEVCGDSTHCMAYLSEAERAERWGKNFTEYEEKLRRAVAATAGEMLFADGEPVKTYFHAACGGRTQTVTEVWGGAAKWQAADCFWEGAAGTVLSGRFFTRQELAEKLSVPEADLPLLKIAAENGDGRVSRVTCGKMSWRGTEFRTLLGLKSTKFNWLATAEGFWFTAQGYGHGVGLCQAGAVGMAEAGYDYRAILAQYYPGLVIAVK